MERRNLTFAFVDEILDEIKDDEKLMKEFVFDFLTALAVNQKYESFNNYEKRWQKVYETPFGKSSIELSRKLLKSHKEGDEK